MKHRVALVTTAVSALLIAGGTAAVTTASAATAGCSATYAVASQWQGGFQGGVSFTNLGDPLSTWKLEFDFPASGQSVTQGWNATWAQSGAHVTATNMTWNGAVATGGSISVGFIGSWSGSNPAPAAFKLNGVACTGSTTSPTTSPTTPRTSPTTTPPTTTPTTPPASGPAPGAAGVRQQARHRGRQDLPAARRQPVQRRVRLRPGQGHVGQRPGRPGLRRRDEGLEHPRRPDPAQRGLLARPVRLAERCGIPDRPSRTTSNLLVANGINPILDLHWTHGAVHRQHLRLRGRQRDLPEADAEHAVHAAVLDQRGERVQGQQRRRVRPVQRALPGRVQQLVGHAPPRGGACATAAPAPASPTRWPACRTCVDAVRATGATNVRHDPPA